MKKWILLGVLGIAGGGAGCPLVTDNPDAYNLMCDLEKRCNETKRPLVEDLQTWLYVRPKDAPEWATDPTTWAWVGSSAYGGCEYYTNDEPTEVACLLFGGGSFYTHVEWKTVWYP